MKILNRLQEDLKPILSLAGLAVLWLLLSSCCFAQKEPVGVPINQLNGARYLDRMIPTGPTFGADSNASISVSSAWSPSGSAWQFPWWEPNVYREKISVTERDQPEEWFDLRVGRSGQMYSFQTPLFGELTPPQTHRRRRALVCGFPMG